MRVTAAPHHIIDGATGHRNREESMTVTVIADAGSERAGLAWPAPAAAPAAADQLGVTALKVRAGADLVAADLQEARTGSKVPTLA